MVARRLREQALFARTIQIKLRYSDFSTFTRARRKAWTGRAIRLLGVYAQSLESCEGQLSLLESDKAERWRKALKAVDRVRDRYGDDSVSLARALEGRFRERVQENPANLPGKDTQR